MRFVSFLSLEDIDIDFIHLKMYLVSCENHSRGVHAFLAGLGTGVDVDFSKRTLVLVGHSMGGPTRCVVWLPSLPA